MEVRFVSLRCSGCPNTISSSDHTMVTQCGHIYHSICFGRIMAQNVRNCLICGEGIAGVLEIFPNWHIERQESFVNFMAHHQQPTQTQSQQQSQVQQAGARPQQQAENQDENDRRARRNRRILVNSVARYIQMFPDDHEMHQTLRRLLSSSEV